MSGGDFAAPLVVAARLAWFATPLVVWPRLARPMAPPGLPAVRMGSVVALRAVVAVMFPDAVLTGSTAVEGIIRCSNTDHGLKATTIDDWTGWYHAPNGDHPPPLMIE